MPRHAAALAQMFPVLQRVGAFAASVQPAATVGDAGAWRHRAFAALRELLARLGDRRPLALHIDDLQWGDVDSAALLSEVLRAPDPPRLLLVASFRSEHADVNPCLQVLHAAAAAAPSQWLRIELPPLDDADARRMAEVLLGETAAADAARIAKEAGGNPYFINELARAASHTGQAPHATSPDIEGIVLARVDALPAHARRLLDVIALAGRPLRVRQAYEAVDSDQFSQAALRLLRTERLVRTTRLALEDWIETYHDRVREAVVRRLPGDTTRTLHWRLALTLESASGADPEAIAEHFAAAGERSRAGTYFARAADAAAQALAFDRAATLYRAALASLDGASTQTRRLRIDLATALANAGRGLDAARAYEAASDDWTGDEALELWRQAATQYCISGHLVEGRRIFERLLRRLGMSLPATPRATFLALALRRAQLRLRGVAFRERTPEEILPEDLRRIDVLWSVAAGLSLPDPLGVAALQTRGLLLALRVGEPYRIARALAVETYLTAAGGWPDADRASRLLATTARVAERLGHPHALGLARLAAGVTALWQMRFGDTVRACEDALLILTERCTGVWWERATAQTIIAWALWHMGQLHELAERTAGYVKEARERGDLLLLTSLGTIVAPHLHLAADRPDRALYELDETVAQLPAEGFHTQHMEAVFSRAHIHLYLGQGQAAVDLIDRSWPMLRRALQLRPQIIRLMMLDLRARAAVAAAVTGGDSSALLRAAERDAARLAKEQSPHAATFYASIMASVAAAGGDRQRATALLQEAADGFDRADLSLRAACARRRRGELIGGDEGIAQVTGADSAMQRQRIVDPARTAALYACAFDY
jgi:hypothetical protein